MRGFKMPIHDWSLLPFNQSFSSVASAKRWPLCFNFHSQIQSNNQKNERWCRIKLCFQQTEPL